MYTVGTNNTIHDLPVAFLESIIKNYMDVYQFPSINGENQGGKKIPAKCRVAMKNLKKNVVTINWAETLMAMFCTFAPDVFPAHSIIVCMTGVR